METNYFNEQNFDWLQKRLGRFTASEIHKLFVGSKKKDELFGAGAMTYIRTKAAELLTMEVKEEYDFKATEWGKANEMDAVHEFEKSIEMKGKYFGIANPQFFNFGEYAGGSPDWETTDEGADVKCPFNSAEHVKNLLLSSADEFKDERWEYYCQAQMLMIVRNWKKFYFVSYDPRMIEEKYRMKTIVIYPDEAWVNEFYERLKAAIAILKSMVSSVEHVEFFIAEHDHEVNATIVTPQTV